MCGRFTLDTTGAEIAAHFDLATQPDLQPRYNIAPTQQVPVVRLPSMEGQREAPRLRWGLVPFWADDTKIGNKLINARSETAHEKPSFRAAFARRRCLVPASGFYEWSKTDDGKQPYYIHAADDGLLGMAGLWERWTSEQTGEVVESFTILTGQPNETVEPLHHRMPVIVQPADYAFWLDPAMKDTEGLRDLVGQTYPADGLDAYPVSTHVNSPANDDPACIQPQE